MKEPVIMLDGDDDAVDDDAGNGGGGDGVPRLLSSRMRFPFTA